MNMKKTYRTLAKRYGVSVSEVKHDMQAAIDEAYKTPNPEALAVPRRGAVATVEEFLDYSVKMIQKNKHK